MQRDKRKEVKTPIEQHKSAPHQQEADDHERHVDGSIHVRGEIETKFPSDLVESYTTGQERSDTRDDKKYVVELLTLIFLGIYTLVTGCQACLTRTAVNNNTTQFQIDQRPYVWDNNVTDPANVKIVAGQRMWINIGLLNFGKAPALRARGIAKIFIGDNAMQDADAWFNAYGGAVLSDDPNDTGIVVPPGIPSGEITAKSAFGGGGYFTPMSDKVLTQDDVDYVLHSNERVAIVVHAEYFDAYGTRYWSNFCLSRFDTGTYPNCKKHNEIH